MKLSAYVNYVTLFVELQCRTLGLLCCLVILHQNDPSVIDKVTVHCITSNQITVYLDYVLSFVLANFTLSCDRHYLI